MPGRFKQNYEQNLWEHYRDILELFYEVWIAAEIVNGDVVTVQTWEECYPFWKPWWFPSRLYKVRLHGTLLPWWETLLTREIVLVCVTGLFRGKCPVLNIHWYVKKEQGKRPWHLTWWLAESFLTVKQPITKLLLTNNFVYHQGPNGPLS